VIFKGARCIGHCSNGPNLVINGKVIEGVGLVQVEKILEAEIGNLK
jgi:NADH:ubiquinone oxidoreductase subunit E